jgi:glycosidase
MPKWLAFRFIKYGARDHSRVPIAWDDSVNGGFNKGHAPWQCVNPLYSKINVKKDKIILNNYGMLGRNGQKVRLRPYQAVVLRF